MDILYKDIESEFYEFLNWKFGKKSRTTTNYIAWLRFLSNENVIDNKMDYDRIKEIVKNENSRRNYREKYKREKDISNFHSALKKYVEFLNYPFLEEKTKLINSKVNDIQSNMELPETEKRDLILSRIGQGKYRNELIKYWAGCSLSLYSNVNFLTASHIKPWKDSTNYERLDKYNGLLLLPNHDRLFDRGYISFKESGQIILSEFLNEEDKQILGVNEKLSLKKLDNTHFKYLEYHRDMVFMK